MGTPSSRLASGADTGAVEAHQRCEEALPTHQQSALAHARSASLSTLNSGTSAGVIDAQGKGSLLARRARLCAQLDKLGQTLSDDLKGSLRLK